MKKIIRHNIHIPPRYGSMEGLPMCVEKISNSTAYAMKRLHENDELKNGYAVTMIDEEGVFEHIAFWIYTQLRYSGNHTESWEVLALLDTGATRSCITDTLARKMKLASNRRIDAGTATGRSEFPLHTIDVILPREKIIENLEVAEIKDDGRGFGFIMGMDIIKKGDMAITHSGSKMMFSFIMPPTENYIDFEKNFISKKE